VGDKVVLSEVGRRAYVHFTSNPHDRVGTVICLNYSKIHPLLIKWKSGGENSYRELHLELHQENPWLECPEGYTEADNHEVSYFMGDPTHYREVEPEVESVEERVMFDLDGHGIIVGHEELGGNATIKGQMLEGKPVGQWVITVDED